MFRGPENLTTLLILHNFRAKLFRITAQGHDLAKPDGLKSSAVARIRIDDN